MASSSHSSHEHDPHHWDSAEYVSNWAKGRGFPRKKIGKQRSACSPITFRSTKHFRSASWISALVTAD